MDTALTPASPDAAGAAGAAGAGLFGVFCFIWIILAAAIIAAKVFWIITIVDVARRKFPEENTKIVWLIVVIMGSFIGAIVYHVVGKPQGTLPRS